MTDGGRAAVEAARADGRWSAAYAGPATRQVPDDLAAAIAAVPDAQAMFDVLTSANRFAVIHRVDTMKRAESRARTFTEMVEMLARNETTTDRRQATQDGPDLAPARGQGFNVEVGACPGVVVVLTCAVGLALPSRQA